MPLINADFVTHSNYLEYLRDNSIELTCSYTGTPAQIFHLSSSVEKKVKLINLTYSNLVGEMRTINQFHDYSSICVSWIPVKSYYLIFNELLILEYLINNSESWLFERHNNVQKEWKRLTTARTINFSNPIFNTIYEPLLIESWSIPVGANVSSRVTSSVRQQEIVKILYRYSREEFRRARNIKTISGKHKQTFYSSTKVTLFDFFYLYRIKANYRDMEFIDSGITINNFYLFYRDYFRITMNFYTALKDIVNQISNTINGGVLIT